MSSEPAILDVSDATFEQDVLARSERVPVVVDFWAAWCGPCRQLGPVLERLVGTELAGSVVLAKVDTDAHPGIARDYQVRGIPAVKAFRNRRVVAEFVGALPEGEVRRFLASLLPSRADRLVDEARAAIASGRDAEAESRLREALRDDPLHPAALLALGRILHSRGALEEAADLLDRVPGSTPEEAEATPLAARARLALAAADLPDEAALAARAAGDPGDVEARYGLGIRLAIRGEFRPALERLLEVVRLDRKFRDDAGRRAMLQVFQAAGTRSDLSDEFRSRLASALY